MMDPRSPNRRPSRRLQQPRCGGRPGEEVSTRRARSEREPGGRSSRDTGRGVIQWRCRPRGCGRQPGGDLVVANRPEVTAAPTATPTKRSARPWPTALRASSLRPCWSPTTSRSSPSTGRRRRSVMSWRTRDQAMAMCAVAMVPRGRRSATWRRVASMCDAHSPAPRTGRSGGRSAASGSSIPGPSSVTSMKRPFGSCQ